MVLECCSRLVGSHSNIGRDKLLHGKDIGAGRRMADVCRNRLFVERKNESDCEILPRE